ncbi:hypothetical protein AB6A40_007911 [Gnathostoma spinigerum]|uniref:Uncharacterized protein n=1 Tax=Gnathostoma spinigerum TaxID=75299 RepID=A0ABD6EX94_9BILA
MALCVSIHACDPLYFRCFPSLAAYSHLPPSYLHIPPSQSLCPSQRFAAPPYRFDEANDEPSKKERNVVAGRTIGGGCRRREGGLVRKIMLGYVLIFI